MSFTPNDSIKEAQKLDISELILLELRVISTLLAEGHNQDVNELRESIQNDYQ